MKIKIMMMKGILNIRERKTFLIDKSLNSISFAEKFYLVANNSFLFLFFSSNKYPPSSPSSNNESHLFELIGVTVHTGTAEGGHYYSFIRERVKRPIDNNNLLTNSDNILDNQQQSQQHR